MDVKKKTEGALRVAREEVTGFIRGWKDIDLLRNDIKRAYERDDVFKALDFALMVTPPSANIRNIYNLLRSDAPLKKKLVIPLENIGLYGGIGLGVGFEHIASWIFLPVIAADYAFVSFLEGFVMMRPFKRQYAEETKLRQMETVKYIKEEWAHDPAVSKPKLRSTLSKTLGTALGMLKGQNTAEDLKGAIKESWADLKAAVDRRTKLSYAPLDSGTNNVVGYGKRDSNGKVHEYYPIYQPDPIVPTTQSAHGWESITTAQYFVLQYQVIAWALIGYAVGMASGINVLGGGNPFTSPF